VCDFAPQSSLPFCDTSLSIDARVDDLVARIPLRDIPGLLGDNSTGSVSVGVPAYGWWSEGLHGVAISPAVSFSTPTISATSFPQILHVAASFNKSLWYEIGNVTSTEARAFHSVGHGGLTYWAPNINIFRDPRWGRGQETPGEDPYLTSAYATSFVQGMQGSSEFLKVSACCKHFSAYSQEIPRHSLSAQVTPQDMADTYFPAFEACVKQGHVSSIMCSYNAVNGIPSCADKHFLTDIVRKEWGFDGYIVSDCGAVEDVIAHHHYTNSTGQTCAATLSAGMDLNCGYFLQTHLLQALDQGIVDIDVTSNALKHLFRTQFRLGLFEKSSNQPYRDITLKDINTPQHQQLALEAAQQSIVLLHNQKVLPLDKDAYTKEKQLVLLGPHLNASIDMLSSYAGVPPFIITPLQGLLKYIPSEFIQYNIGCSVTNNTVDPAAIKLVAAASTFQVVLFVGLNESIESEGLDRHNILLPQGQLALIRQVLATSKSLVTLVLLSGGAVDLSEFKNHPKVGAIVYAGYLGQAGGQAIADVLVGEVNPSGRLTQTFYHSSYLESIAMDDMHMRPEEQRPGRTHRFYTGNAVFPFGYGLSYTFFRYDCPEYNDLVVAGDEYSVVVMVQNVGELIGDEVLLCFAKPPNAGINGRPRQSLVAFDKIKNLVPGDLFEWNLHLPPPTFQLASVNGAMEFIPGTWTLQLGTISISLHVVLPDSDSILTVG
ncbi:beta-D-xylosidase, partial [Thraustotheca clavata]